MNSQKTKIAIIEDDLAIVQMYRVKFELEGFDVRTAGDGESGLELIKEFQPDVILLDLMMPNMNGMDMLQSLRKQAGKSKTKIIVLTNMDNPATVKQVFDLGANDYIIKAEMTPRQVADKVKKVLS